MLTHINDLLQRWAEWRLGANRTSGVQSQLGRIMEQGGRRVHEAGPPRAIVIIDELECERTDRAVNALHPRLRAVAAEYYCRIGTADMAAARLGCCKATLYRLVHELHVGVMDGLNDLAAGIPVYAWGYRPEHKTLDTVRLNRADSGNLV